MLQNTPMNGLLVAYATFYLNRNKAFETSPIGISCGTDAESHALPLQWRLSLSSLDQGEYILLQREASPFRNGDASL
jgi:hypothetical protein